MVNVNSWKLLLIVVFLSIVCFQAVTALGATHAGLHTSLSMGCEIPASRNGLKSLCRAEA